MEFVEGGQVNDRAYMEKNRIDVNEVRWGLVLGQRDRGTVCGWPRPGLWGPRAQPTAFTRITHLSGRVLPHFPICSWAWSGDRVKPASLSMRLLLASFLTAAKSIQMGEQHSAAHQLPPDLEDYSHHLISFTEQGRRQSCVFTSCSPAKPGKQACGPDSVLSLLLLSHRKVPRKKGVVLFPPTSIVNTVPSCTGSGCSEPPCWSQTLSANSSDGIITTIRTQALSPPPSFLSPSHRPMWVHSRTCSHLMVTDQ